MRSRLSGAFRAQADLLENALSLGGSTLVTSLLGAVYWWVAARMLDPASVGYGSAATSAATLLATIGMAGYGSLLLGHVASSGKHKGNLIATGLAVSGGASLIIGSGFGLFVHNFAQSFAPYCAAAGGIVLFSATTSLTGLTTVLDDALVGLFLGSVQLKRNSIFAAAKVALLAALAALIPDGSGEDVLASWTIGLAISIVATNVLLIRQGKQVWHTPRLVSLRQSAKTAMMHHWINLSTVAPRLLLPLVVTAVVSAAANGWLYPAWIIATLAFVIPQHLSTSLFAVGAANRGTFAAKTRTSLKLALAAGIPLTGAVALLANPLLSIFGSDYAQHASTPLRWLMLAYIPNVVRFHYVTVRRVEGKLVEAAIVMTALGLVETAGALIGSQLAGLNGVAAVLAIAMWAEGLATAPPVLRTILSRPRKPAFSAIRPRSKPPKRRPDVPSFPRSIAMPIPRPSAAGHTICTRSAQVPDITSVAQTDSASPHSLVSVVIPTTGRQSVADAVNSVLSQTHAAVEVIVIYDGSGRLPVAVSSDSRVTIATTGARKGVSRARNLGISLANGDYVALLDDDDTWRPDKLATQISLLNSHGASDSGTRIVASRVQLVDETGQPKMVVPTRLIRDGESVADYLFRRRKVRWGEAIIHPSTLMCKRALAGRILWPDLVIHEDWDWLLHLVTEAGAQVVMAEESLTNVTETTGSASRSTKWRESLAWVLQAQCLTGRQKADLLLCTTAAYARAARNRRAVLRIARHAVSVGPPGFAASTFFVAFQVFPPQILTRLARAVRM